MNDGQFHPHAIPVHVWCTSQDHSFLLIGGEGEVGRGEGGSEVGRGEGGSEVGRGEGGSEVGRGEGGSEVGRG